MRRVFCLTNCSVMPLKTSLSCSGTLPWTTWTPKVCKIMAFMAIIRGLGSLFYILLGFR